MRNTIRILATAVLMTLAACTSAPSTSTTGIPQPATSSSTPAPWSVSVVSAKTVVTGPAKAKQDGSTAWADDIKAGNTAVTVTWRIRNTSGQLVTPVPNARLVSGPNAVPGEVVTSWVGKQALHTEPMPEQIGVGSEATLFQTWQIPTTSLGAAELRVSGLTGGAETRTPVPAP